MRVRKVPNCRFTRALRGISLVAASCVGSALLVSDAHALTDTDSMLVTATVVASCDVDATDLAFGNYDPVSSTPLDAATNVSVICTNGTAYVVSMDAGGGSGASVTTRKMTSSGNLLSYSLYRDVSRSLVWGQTSGVNTVAGTGTGVAQNISVYGRVPASQTAPVGSYTDTVVVTVTFN